LIGIFGAGWDNSLQKKTFTLTVGSGGTRSASSSAGIHVCSPVNGSTVSSPVHSWATGKVSDIFSNLSHFAGQALTRCRHRSSHSTSDCFAGQEQGRRHMEAPAFAPPHGAPTAWLISFDLPPPPQSFILQRLDFLL
jgi:hypothetical protein